MYGRQVTHFVRKSEWDESVRHKNEREANKTKWEDDHPYEEWRAVKTAEAQEAGQDTESDNTSKYAWSQENPYRAGYSSERLSDYQPFDKTSVFYDEMLAEVHAQIKKWNRVSVIIQGLYDRTSVLHPHPPVRAWEQDSFAANIELVYDGERTIYAGEKPDFEKYRADGLRFLKSYCVTIGQQDAWLEREVDKERARRRNDYRSAYRDRDVPSWWKPDGDKGPGFIAQVVDIRKGEAGYRWQRNRKRASWKTQDQMIEGSIRVPIEKLFNVTAYRPGDYRQFFEDPRTREEYLQWANLLLSAEEWHAGNKKPRWKDET